MTHTDRTENLLDRFVETVNPPGMAAAVIHRGELVTVYEYGYADLDAQTPITPATRFRLGMVTQAFTAAAVLKSGIDRHAPIDAALPTLTLQTPDAPITPHQLLTHSAGLGGVRSVRALLRPDDRLPMDDSVPDLPTHYDGEIRAQVEPGTKWCFSRDGYAMLGELLARDAATSTEAAIQAAVFDPLGMAQTDFGQPATTAYKKNNTPITPYQTVLAGAMGACGSINDLITFVGALLSADARLLTAEDRALMWTPHVQLDDRLPGMGYGFRVDVMDGHPIAWINSDIEGYSAAMWLAPESQTAVIALMNTRRDGLLAALARKIISGLLDIETTPSTQTLAQVANAADFVGYFAPTPGLLTNLELWAAYGGGISVRQKGGQLRINGQIDPATTRPLYPTDSPLAFRYQSAGGMPLLVFKRGADDTVDRLCIGLYELHRTSYWRSLGGRLMLVVGGAGLAFVLILLAIGLAG